MAYNLELREKAVAAVAEKGRNKKDIVELFGISLASLNRWFRQQREQGQIRIKRPPGRNRSIDKEGYRALERQVEEQPAGSLQSYCELLAAQGYKRVSRSTLQRMLARLAMTRKKNASSSSEK